MRQAYLLRPLHLHSMAELKELQCVTHKRLAVTAMTLLTAMPVRVLKEAACIVQQKRERTNP